MEIVPTLKECENATKSKKISRGIERRRNKGIPFRCLKLHQKMRKKI